MNRKSERKSLDVIGIRQQNAIGTRLQIESLPILDAPLPEPIERALARLLDLERHARRPDPKPAGK
jgi:hypothetical protein